MSEVVTPITAEQLRERAARLDEQVGVDAGGNLARQAADTIDALTAKLAQVKQERSVQHQEQQLEEAYKAGWVTGASAIGKYGEQHSTPEEDCADWLETRR